MIKKQGLYDPEFEHDSCGVGFVANINGTKTHQIIQDGLTILKNLIHRGAVGGDAKTGDGCGILTQIPHEFFKKECQKIKISLPDIGAYGVGTTFLPRSSQKKQLAKEIITTVISKEGGKLLGFRDVPVKPDCLGELALDVMPAIEQFFVEFKNLKGIELERKLYVVRKVIENNARNQSLSNEDFYIPSFSCKTVNYKGMFVAPQLEHFYPDLSDTSFISGLALIHQRYSTNTFPSWYLSQPFRFLAHNGEINTLRGNFNKMKARESSLASDLFKEDLKKLFPINTSGASDSAIFDNTFELLVLGGRSLEHAMMMMVPEPFGKKYHISEDKRAFYEYHASIMEPWDGPAALAFTDGDKIGALLDRNGLRPVRYVVSKQGKIVMASEVGVLEFAPEDVLEKGRLAPGKMLLVDTINNRLMRDNEIKAAVSRKQPYRRWLEENKIELKGLFETPDQDEIYKENLLLRQNLFALTSEDVKTVIEYMSENAQEPVSSMGNDAALAVLSDQPQMLYNYFKQLFAQVTNPPIDPYRENLVMSLMSFIGRERNLLSESKEHCRQLKLMHPILTNHDIQKITKLDLPDFKVKVVPIVFNVNNIPNPIEKALTEICNIVEKYVDDGASIIILSDKNVDKDNAPIPSLLATSCIHHHLVKVGKRHLTGLIIETGETRDVMHFATLIGYGASAINPYLAIETIVDLYENKTLKPQLSLESSIDNYITAVKKGLLKILSKMGISTIRSYKGAQIFEAVGLHENLINKYFPDTPSRIGGIDLPVIEKETIERHKNAFKKLKNQQLNLPSGGNYHYREFTEKRTINPESIGLIQKAVRENNYEIYKKFSQSIHNTSKNLSTLRGLFTFRKQKSIPLSEVEPIENIYKRFVSSAMSFGSISKEAHETMAIAMNRIGAMSNSGEGGEEVERYTPLPNGDSRKSTVKQVASGRFGVTSHYLVNSNELQIKMAQGAKPGEGGQLPGYKVDNVIAKVRHSTPGVMLISPPPHHDIYSIEDLAQLIYDLKNANPEARVSVKLVSEVGVGTIAAGVAKGKADMVLISGHDGGTGASPLSSIKYAGMPWEIGLAETQQTLVLNSLRDKIRVQVDGKLLTGRDIVIGALLGAEEFGFGTMALVVLGCIMMRKCHLNTCPVGIATQNPDLRKRFPGKPEHLVNYMTFVASEVREIMAELGIRNFDDLVGQVDLLDVNNALLQWKTKGLDFEKLLMKPPVPKGSSYRCTIGQKHDFSLSLDGELIAKSKPALEKQEKVKIAMKIRNCNRTVGATLSSIISRKYGENGIKDDTIHCKFEGSAGQSFAAFLAKGVTFEVEGDANDYFCKGLSGGKVIIYPPKNSTFRPQNNIITGNVNLFGATQGEVYICGMAGERFAVRNSGASAVVEGVGDHGCEYMTGGVVVVLGQTGINFAAGMSGGIAFILDENQLFDTNCNLEMVNIEPVNRKDDQALLKSMLEKHLKYTNSKLAETILKSWMEFLPLFVKVMPIDYKKAMERIKLEELKKSQDTEVVTMTEEVTANG